MKNGFSLLEFMVYIALFSISMTLMFHFLSMMHHKFILQTQQAQWLQTLYNAQHQIVREFESAPMSKQQWKNATENELIIAYPDEDRGLCVAKNKLIYMHGRFNGHSWIKKHKNVLADHIQSIHFKYLKNGDTITGVCWEIIGESEEKTYTIMQYVSLRNQSVIHGNN